VQGSWGAVDLREGGTWKIKMLTWNVAEPPQPSSTNKIKLPASARGEVQSPALKAPASPTVRAADGASDCRIKQG
jgi:hypothetical protein